MLPIEKKKYACSLCVMAAAVSFLGFLLENLWLFFARGVIDNRNMRAPFLYGYGIGIVLLYLLAGTPSRFMPFVRRGEDGKRIPEGYRYLLYFLLSFAAVTVSELSLGFAFELVMGFDYWDYSALPLNITKYSSVFTSLGFGIVITLFMEFGFSRLLDLFLRLPYRMSRLMAVALSAVLSADLVFSFYEMYSSGGLNILWQIRLPWA